MLPVISSFCCLSVQFDRFSTFTQRFVHGLPPFQCKFPIIGGVPAIALDLSLDIACHEGSCHNAASHGGV
ncbi:MAG: hypothetical protein CFE31_07915 [Rhizobiales bacterium PAR1]|nr:MAG: hypothetical protein CFE31_07915 [Rhizobiales bacterium PAR1]